MMCDVETMKLLIWKKIYDMIDESEEVEESDEIDDDEIDDDEFDESKIAEQVERAKVIAKRIRKADDWNMDDCAELCRLADMEDEWEAATGETFKRVVMDAADIMGVSLLRPTLSDRKEEARHLEGEMQYQYQQCGSWFSDVSAKLCELAELEDEYEAATNDKDADAVVEKAASILEIDIHGDPAKEQEIEDKIFAEMDEEYKWALEHPVPDYEDGDDLKWFVKTFKTK